MSAIRILYIDDDAGLGRLVAKHLGPEGFAITHVSSGAEGLARLAKETFDVVALDHTLAGEVGLDVLEQIRAREGAPPVVYVTGSDDARVAVAALKAGAVDYVWKDVQGHYRELLGQAARTAMAQERVRAERDAAEREVREGRDRAMMLLAEVNHRVANSLSLVGALAHMQANQLEDEGGRNALKEMQARIAAIAGVHKRLYTSEDVRVVDLDVYLSNLLNELSEALDAPDKPIAILSEIEAGLRIATDKAVSVGVVVTELVTNAYKYAYPETGGEIRVVAKRVSEQRMLLSVEDSGIGWDSTQAVKGTGVGSRIVQAMSQTLNASLTYEPRDPGLCVHLEFDNVGQTAKS